MQEAEIITITQALEIALEKGLKVSRSTLIRWVSERKPKLTYQPFGISGKMYMNRDAFIKFITGKLEAGSDDTNA